MEFVKYFYQSDAFHQETIPLEPVKYFAECMKKSGIDIKLNPAWLVSEDDNNPYNVKTRDIIKKFDYLNIPIGAGNIIFPSGNALKYLGEYFEENMEYSSPYDENHRCIRYKNYMAFYHMKCYNTQAGSDCYLKLR